MKILSRLRPHWVIICICILYSLIGTLLICTWFRYQINPDATSYFTIAYKYAHGDFRHAINGYWGPAFSALLIPAVWLHANMIIAAKIVILLAGLAIIVSAYWFMHHRRVSKLITNFICVLLGLYLLQWATYNAITPDLLMALLGVWLVMLLDRFLTKPTTGQGILLGALGATMYFTKGFGLFLFIGVIGIVALWQWWQSRVHILVIVRRYLPIAITLLVLVVPFLVLISVKYNKLTINNAGDFDHRIYGPVARQVVPMTVKGPLAPPNSSAISVWEEPTHNTELVPNWSPLDSYTNFKFFFGSIVRTNLNTTLHSINEFGPLFGFGVIAIILLALDRKARRQEAALFVTVSMLMIIGYSLVLTETRYLWTVVVYGLLSIGLWTAHLRKKGVLDTAQITVVGLLVCAICSITATQAFLIERNTGKKTYDQATSLRRLLPQNSHIISDSFNDSYQTCFYLQLQCFSVLAAPDSAQAQHHYYQLLQNLGITYYVNYHMRPTSPSTNRFIDTYFKQINQRTTAGQTITTYQLVRGL
jgi:hypothetical protein